MKFIDKYPECNGKIKVSGGCGFDIYKIRPSISKTDFLKQKIPLPNVFIMCRLTDWDS